MWSATPALQCRAMPSPARVVLSAPSQKNACGHGWSDSASGAEVRFLGRGAPPQTPLAELVAPGLAEGVRPSWLRQVHGAAVLEAQPGLCGSGDALTCVGEDLALVVVTADCVPVLLAGGRRIAAVHAGWRGIVAGVVSASVSQFAPRVEWLTAWIGPAIGACCYEVGEEVAGQVERAAHGAECVLRRLPRPHLDLRAAVEAQLAAAGVDEIRHLDLCTRCHPDLLWSYRRDGPRAGRNLAWIVRPPADVAGCADRHAETTTRS